MCRHAGSEGDPTQRCAACCNQVERFLLKLQRIFGQKIPDREEYVDGAEYLLKHEEDTHIEGQVSSQYSGTDVQVNMGNARILYGPIHPATHPKGPNLFK